MRTGTTVLLGAGASVEAGYPLAQQLLRAFGLILSKEGDKHLVRILMQLWGHFVSMTHLGSNAAIFPPPEPYLEDFFAFYDQLLLHPSIGQLAPPILQTDEGVRALEKLEQLAYLLAYRSLSPNAHVHADYLLPLLGLPGPFGGASVIATLNFDLALEQVAFNRGLQLFDGFENTANSSHTDWPSPDLGAAEPLWEATTENTLEWAGIGSVSRNQSILLKLHGSLGWFALQEGRGSIGANEGARFGVPYRTFRLPHGEWFSGRELPVDELASGQWIATRSTSNVTTQKAGGMWVAPYMAYSQATKPRSDLVSMDLVGTFALALQRTKTVLAIGYSWSDSHINNLILESLGRGAVLVNIAKDSSPTLLRTLLQLKFRARYSSISERTFHFGGGARQVLNEGSVVLPTDKSRSLDLLASLRATLPANASLAAAAAAD